MPLLVGCTGFFVPESDTGGGTGGGGTGNFAYIGNTSTSSIAGFTVGTGTLTAVSGSPLAAGYVPLSMVVTPNNNFLYVGGSTGIYLYLINSNGSLSVPSTGAIQTVAFAVSLVVSPDGQWLIALDGNSQVLDIYQINSTTGALALIGQPTYTVASGVWVPSEVTISPDGTLIFAALGTGGDAIFTFTTSTGVALSSTYLPPVNATTGDNGLAVSPSSTYLFIARSGTSGGVAVYSIASGGLLTSVTGSPFAAGTGPSSVVLDKTGTYAYVGNKGDGTISGYTIAAGTTPVALTLTPLSGSPYKSGTTVRSLGIDNTGKYLLATASGGAPDLTMYSFDITTPGKLDAATSVATATDPAGAAALAMTH
jgi:6-phosphogluconolactonase